MAPRPPEDELVALVRALIIAEGVTTADGNLGFTSFIDARLIGAVGIVNTTAVIFPGQPLQAQVRDTTVFNAGTGEVTVSAAFAARVLAGTPYVILAAPPTVAEVAAIAANLVLLMADVGDASGSTLGSLYAILGNPPAAQTFLAMIGYEGAAALATKLTAARAALLDRLSIITAGGAGELTAARAAALQRLIDDLTAARAGYLDNINQAGLLQVTAARAGYLDNINQVGLLQVTAGRAALLDVLSLIAAGGAGELTAARAAALQRLIDDLTAARAGYLDNINQAGLLQVTAARATLLDQITALRLAELDAANIPADVDTLLARLTALRAGYLDNINQAGLLQVTAARAGYLDKLPNFQHEVEWASTPVSQQVASAVLTDLTAGSITPTFPTGATRVRALLLASIGAANQAANTHHIGFTVQGQKDAGGYVTQLTLTAVPPLALVNLDGAGDSWAGAIDVTTLVDASGSTYTFRFQVDSDNAGAVNYTTGFVLLLVYRI